MRSYHYILLLLLVTTLSCGLVQILSTPRINNIHNGVPPDAKLDNKYHAADGTTWALLSADYFGFPELWLTKSIDGQHWSRPIYTAIPVQNGPYSWEIKDSTLVIVLKGYSTVWEVYHYTRENMDTCGDTCYIYLTDLLSDVDNDGLTDLAEWALLTDPVRPDTDGDGVPDNQDFNPLAPHQIELLPVEKLHKFIIDATLEQFDSEILVMVERFNKRPMEYKRDRGYVLNLPAEQINTFVDDFGYGVPILRAIVTKQPKEYHVDFEFFISPDNAWGYTAVYTWRDDVQEWIHQETLDSWDA